MTKMQELTTERDLEVRLVQFETRSPPLRFVRIKGRLCVDALGWYWPVRFVAAAVGLLAIAAALWAWLGR